MNALSRLCGGLLAATALAFLESCAGGENAPTDPTQNTARLAAIPASASLLFTSNLYSTEARAGRETFAVDAEGATVTRLTFCNETTACDTIEAAPAADRGRILVRRTLDSNNDGAIGGGDATVLLYQDLPRGVQARFVESVSAVTGVDWTGDATFVLFSAPSSSTLDDLFTTNGKGEVAQGIFRNVTSTVGLIERRPRLRVDGNAGVFERIADGTPAAIFIISVGLPAVVTRKDPGGDLLPGTLYRAGSDADPGFSPDGVSVVFRRLTAITPDGRGQWDIMTALADGTNLRTVASGPTFRGAPDWGAQGIVFPEADAAAGTMTLVAVAADGTNRRVILSAPGTVTISNPRWLTETR